MGVFYTDSSTGTIVGSGGTILRTTHGGGMESASVGTGRAPRSLPVPPLPFASDSGPVTQAFADAAWVSRALSARAEDLAAGVLLEAYSLQLARAAAIGVTVRTRLDGREQTINQSNAKHFIALYATRIKSYQAAIQRRGFPNVQGAYQSVAGQSCGMFTNSRTTIQQRGFEVVIVNDSVGFQGIVVDSTIAIQDPLNPDSILIGRVLPDRIELPNADTQCVVALTREKRA